MFVMYLHARLFCTLALCCMSSIPLVQCQSFKPVLSQCSQTGVVTVDDFIALYTPSYVFYSHGWNKFLHARIFLHLLIPLLFPCSYIFYSHGCNVRAWNPVLTQCSQTGFVTVDDFIALYTCSYVIYSNGCNKFLCAITFFYTPWCNRIAPWSLKFDPMLIDPWSQIIKLW